MNIHEQTVPQFVRILIQVTQWLDKAQAFATEKKFKPENLLGARLAPDQLHLTRQIQLMSDHAKNGAARLAGVEAPKFEDKEATVDELRARVTKTVEFLSSLKPEHFQGAEERKVTVPFTPNLWLPGSEYVVQYLLPNFYFHATMTYALLRHNFIELGKQDYLGPINLRTP
jgi:uncharacterized protein